MLRKRKHAVLAGPHAFAVDLRARLSSRGIGESMAPTSNALFQPDSNKRKRSPFTVSRSQCAHVALNASGRRIGIEVPRQLQSKSRRAVVPLPAERAAVGFDDLFRHR